MFGAEVYGLFNEAVFQIALDFRSAFSFCRYGADCINLSSVRSIYNIIQCCLGCPYCLAKYEVCLYLDHVFLKIGNVILIQSTMPIAADIDAGLPISSLGHRMHIRL